MKHRRPNRRQLLQMGAAIGGSVLTGRLLASKPSRGTGIPLGPYGERSLSKAVRWTRESKTPETGSALHLPRSVGILTPSALTTNASLGHSDNRSRAPSSRDSWSRGSAALAFDGRHPAPSVCDPDPRARMRRQQRRRMDSRWRSGRSAESRASQWKRVDRNSVVAAARRSRRAVARVVGDCRRRRRLSHDAQHSTSQGDGRFAARIRPERRGDAPPRYPPAAQSRVGATPVKWLQSPKLTDQPHGATKPRNTRIDA